jgi:hypothetical protein
MKVSKLRGTHYDVVYLCINAVFHFIILYTTVVVMTNDLLAVRVITVPVIVTVLMSNIDS